MLYLLISLLLIAAIAAGGGFAYAQTLSSAAVEEVPDQGSASGIANAQLYWRELEQARDWDGLKAQLRRWQQVANPGWDEAQIEEVTHALNQAVFRFAEPAR
jgi:hypothetical protein